MKTSITTTIITLLTTNTLLQAQAATCQGSHGGAWGGATWESINKAIAQTCNSQPYNDGYKAVEVTAGYQIASAEADVGTGGSPNCWAAMYQIRDQCLDTGKGHYATQGEWQYGDEYYFLWAWDQADCRHQLAGGGTNVSFQRDKWYKTRR
ncbi:hypothetical protein TSTA_115420 [Talaromyces stipitatus ATCC 10500]|uniref:Uncharacterized protein n=1 Tax=Talaromyces stipitatus (strain ATCC 10500 / CBS 375.48 / QM 6759 / NRRL 1006) TaxID=441959 RepID=B8MAQ4_TALSN|nr:uncharacterized protein TSTA_115420 [Talaromyces stipitatus ATCC 10500]EED17744.1 hypothetical protein TSTA_115420 [Talaromyces stipitatus ATCC 10500]